MKTKLLILGILAAFFAGCKKDYSCNCTQVYYQETTTSGEPYTNISTFSNTLHDKEDRAKATCSGMESVTSVGNSTTTITCELH